MKNPAMDEKNQNGSNGVHSEQGQSGYGSHVPGEGPGWGHVYRDPSTGEPQNWQRTGPVPGSPCSANEKAFSILSYIGILWLVGLLTDRDNPTVIFHVNQGIILSIFEFALTFTLGITNAIINGVFQFAFGGIGFLSWAGTAVSGLLSFTVWCVIAAYMIIGVVYAAQGKKEPLPLIGNLFTVVH